LGAYELTIEKDGFSKYAGKFNLSVGQILDIPVTLSVATLNQQVVVTEEAPLIEAARTQVSNNIETREIATLPLNGRNYIDLALLVPGVSKTNTGNNERFAETSAVPGTGISVAGQRNLANGFVVDGLSSNDDAADLAGTFFSQEVIREFQVITSGGIAEYGRASGGIMNVVTQSGTNEWRGKLYGRLHDVSNQISRLQRARRP
jgi:outer membrane receptor for ferrienterochelin and colicin